MRIVVLLLLISGSLTVTSCGNQQKRWPLLRRQMPYVGEQFPTLDSPSLQFLPRQEEVTGWRLEADPLVLPSRELRRYLDGDAVHFLRYEVVDLTTGTYQRTGGSGFATVQIFRFPDFIKAFGAYSTRRIAVVGFLPIPNESFAGKHSIHIWRGPFYIRILGGGSQESMNTLKDLAGAVADRMPAATSKPAVLGFFPETNRIPNSEEFRATSTFGQPYFVNTFTALFNVDGEPVEAMIRPVENKQAAEVLLNRYKNFYLANGKMLDPVTNLGENNFTAEDPYAGRTVAFRIDRFLIVLRGYGQRQKVLDLAIATDQRILGTIRKQLVAADKAESTASRREEPATATVPSWTTTTAQ